MTPAQPRIRQPREVWVLATISVLVALGFGVVIPVLSVYTASFGVNQALVGLVVSAFAAMRLAISPAVPWLLTRLGERTTLASGIAIVSISSALMVLATSYGQLLIFRAFGGIGSAMFTISAMNLLLAKAPPGQRARAISMFQGGFLIGAMTGPAIGGVLGAVSLTAPFWFYAAMLAVAGLVGLFLLSPSPGRQLDREPAEPSRSFAEVLGDSRYQAALVANFAHGWTSMGIRNALTPIVVTQFLHRDPVWTGTAFAVAAVVQSASLIPVGRFVDTTGRRPALLSGAAICGAAIVAVPLASSVWILIAAMAVYGLGASMMSTAPAASVADAAGPRSARPVAVFSMMSDVGQVIGPLVAGFMWDHASPLAAYATGTILMAATLAFACRMPSTPPTERSAGAPAAE